MREMRIAGVSLENKLLLFIMRTDIADPINKNINLTDYCMQNPFVAQTDLFLLQPSK